MKKHGLKGRRVRLKETGERAVISWVDPNKKWVWLDRRIAGFYTWNLNDLEVLPSKGKIK